MSPNARGSLFMVAAMALFAVEDMWIKEVAATLPVGQILLVLGLSGGIVFLLLALLRDGPMALADLLRPAVLARNAGEMVGTFGYVTAVALIPISTASTILQATPLVVTMGAALFLREAVGWRRWTAILTGFAGVLLVLRPTGTGFAPEALFAVLGVAGLAFRDIATRRIPAHVTSLHLSAQGFLALIPVALLLLHLGPQGWTPPTSGTWARLAAASAIGIGAYFLLVLATRTGDVAIVAPFRYSRIFFALIIGLLVFDERPDALTLLGAGIIVASGLYTLLRERRLRRARQAAAQRLDTARTESRVTANGPHPDRSDP